MNSQPIPADIRHLHTSAMEAEAKGHTGTAQAIRELLRQRIGQGAIWTLASQEKAGKGIK